MQSTLGILAAKLAPPVSGDEVAAAVAAEAQRIADERKKEPPTARYLQTRRDELQRLTRNKRLAEDVVVKLEADLIDARAEAAQYADELEAAQHSDERRMFTARTKKAQAEVADLEKRLTLNRQLVANWEKQITIWHDENDKFFQS